MMSVVYSNHNIIKKMSDEQRFNFLVDLAIPWYIHFYVSWNDCINKTFVTYEDLNIDTFATLKNILQELELSDSDENIKEYINRASKLPTKKNVAKIGRGEMLPQKLKDRVRKFASYYPDVDFTPIGIHL
jgi:hypothetical protein